MYLFFNITKLQNVIRQSVGLDHGIFCTEKRIQHYIVKLL